MALIDSYSEINSNSDQSLKALHPDSGFGISSNGQCFTCSINAKITSAKFYLKKTGSPIGNAHAELYAMTGTYGSSGEPTGNVLATSNNFAVADLTASMQLITFTFTGAEQYVMSPNSYCITFTNPTSGTIDSSNYPIIGRSNTLNHDGNNFAYYVSQWVAASSREGIFYVYGEAAAAGTNIKINIGDTFKDVSEIKINIGDSWKAVTQVKQNIGDSWKMVF